METLCVSSTTWLASISPGAAAGRFVAGNEKGESRPSSASMSNCSSSTALSSSSSSSMCRWPQTPINSTSNAVLHGALGENARSRSPRPCQVAAGEALPHATNAWRTREVVLPPRLHPDRMPNHIGIIRDGNNRWAKAKGVSGREGVDSGLRALREVVKSCNQWGIEILTLFEFSHENWNRSKEEVDTIFELLEVHLRKNREAIMRHNIQVSVIGLRERFTPKFTKLVDLITEESRNNDGLKIVVAVGYSGRVDIVHACKGVAQKVADKKISLDDITEQTLEAELMTNFLHRSDVDLLIRTSGEQRISNFTLWQLAYSELVFLQENWPDISPESLEEALAIFQTRNRTLGARKQKF